jgi:uncharacterized protein
MEVRRNEKGRAVYADRDYQEGEIVETCEVIVIPKKELGLTDIMMFYVFVWGEENYAVVLGNGSLYNHSYQPNMAWDEAGHHLVFTAIRAIQAGEELTHNYNGEADREEKVFFLDEDRARFARGETPPPIRMAPSPTEEAEMDTLDEEIINYPGGTTQVKRNGKTFSVVYNTGDKIWMSPEGEVIRIETHDGIKWSKAR